MRIKPEFAGTLSRIALLSVLTFLLLSTAHASPIIMTDGATSLQVNPDSPAGMSSWTPGGGPNIMPLQWFWFGTGAAGFNQTPLQSLDTLGVQSVSFDPTSPNFAEITYASANLGVDMVLNLADGEPSVLSEQITWTNNSASTLYLTIFDYLHFQFSANADALSISGNQAQQSGAYGSSDIEVSPFATGYVGYEAATFSTILDSLTNPATNSGFNVDNLGSATGNVEGLFEWQVALPSNDSFALSLNESADSFAPEPGSGALIAVGVLSLWALRRFARCGRAKG